MASRSHPRIYDYRVEHAHYAPVEARSMKFYSPLVSGRILVLRTDRRRHEIIGILHGRFVRLWLTRNEAANWMNGDGL